jgi:hypothetical protein
MYGNINILFSVSSYDPRTPINQISEFSEMSVSMQPLNLRNILYSCQSFSSEIVEVKKFNSHNILHKSVSVYTRSENN